MQLDTEEGCGAPRFWPISIYDATGGSKEKVQFQKELSGKTLPSLSPRVSRPRWWFREVSSGR
jgi:hypothetical protein